MHSSMGVLIIFVIAFGLLVAAPRDGREQGSYRYRVSHPILTDTTRWSNAGSMLGKRLRRFPTIEPALARRYVLPPQKPINYGWLASALVTGHHWWPLVTTDDHWSTVCCGKSRHGTYIKVQARRSHWADVRWCWAHIKLTLGQSLFGKLSYWGLDWQEKKPGIMTYSFGWREWMSEWVNEQGHKAHCGCKYKKTTLMLKSTEYQNYRTTSQRQTATTS